MRKTYDDVKPAGFGGLIIGVVATLLSVAFLCWRFYLMGEVSGRRDNLSLKVTYDIPTLVEQLPNDGFAYVSSEFIFEFPTRSPRIWSYAYCWPTWSADHPLALQRLSTGKLSLRVPFNVREVSWQKQLPPKVPESKFQDLVVVWEPEK